MCCNFAYWKKVFIFALTFALGVFIAGFFNLNKPIPAEITVCPFSTEKQSSSENKKAEINSAPKAKACLPLDDSVEFKRVVVKGEVEYYMVIKEPKTQVEKEADHKKALQENQERSARKPLYNSPQYPDPYQYSLHEERCFDLQTQ